MLSLVALILAVDICAWRFARREGRYFRPAERRGFLLACFIAFWFVDELGPFAAEWLSGNSKSLADFLYAAEDSAIDFLVVLAVVYVTAPLVERWLLAGRQPNTSLERTRER